MYELSEAYICVSEFPDLRHCTDKGTWLGVSQVFLLL